MDIRLSKFNEEVYFAQGAVTKLAQRDIDGLRDRALENARMRARICAHPNVDESLHEMFIVHTRDTYVRPHKHLNKSESLHVIEGTVDIVLFDQQGEITGISPMGDYQSGRTFFHRISEPYFHTLLISSDTLIFHEATAGPFRATDTIWAPWAPRPEDEAAVNAYLRRLTASVERFNTTS